MKVSIRNIIVLLSAIILMTSCLSTDDDSNITYYSDTAITAFSLGTLNKYYYTKTKYTDEDSLVKTTITGSKYKFYIDQTACKIYNNDSLPQGTDAAHVICTISSMNSGTVILKYYNQAGEDSLAYYSSSDSIDFSVPREVRVYSNDGSAMRSYEVSVNVHKEDPDSFKWNNCATVDAFKTFTGMKAVNVGGKVLVLGSDGTKTFVYSTSVDDGKTWTKTSMELGADAYKNTAIIDGKLFVVNNGTLVSTSDGVSWTDVASFSKSKLLGAGSKKLYAAEIDGGIVASEDGGLTWQAETVDGDMASIPATDWCMATLPIKTNDNTERLIMTGLRDLTANPTDTASVVWSKVEEYADNATSHSWILYESDYGERIPALTNMSMTRYGDVLVAMGGSPKGAAQSLGFTYLYMSQDNGLTWQHDSDYILPDGFTNGTSDVFAMAADSNNVLWIISGGTGDVWRGRLNKLGWATWKDSFTE